ncbi:Domain of uncharacterised function (DUF1841) [Legionella busanensis]|uniref:Domain of uncharacterized function (DUF1841) n=1 Tax=Legionella busanensis TaxID=190655 RepID=A0A378JFI8_9GAMM|nr:DUF1841 family protein [Legionella busanensis]STX50026.1 Domain of uncharacterised function (DUF1841) [Legionella busanensis]
MFFGNSVEDTRQIFFTSWRKYTLKEVLTPLEQQLVDVILAHPEYHSLLAANNGSLNQQYFPELGQTNPFLHMGLHLAIREQIATNRPVGITKCFKKLVERYQDPLLVEHKMMDCLAECLWHAQRNQMPPDENAYITALGLL